MADETIEVEFLVKTQKAIEDTLKLTTQVEALKLQLKEVAAQAGSTFDQAASGMKSSFKSGTGMAGVPDASKVSQFNQLMTRALREVKKETKEAENAARSLDKELKQKPADAGKVQKAFSSLGDVTKYVFGTVLGISAIQALRELAAAFVATIQSGVEFANSIYKLGASTRALQRSGMQITIKEVVQQVKDLRQEFSFLSQREAIAGVAAIQTLTRSFGFTQEQMAKTTEAAVVLATVTGKDFGETARELGLFLSSGYAESMQKAGLAINRVRVAEEAATLGWKGGYNALSENERATAALSLVMKELAPWIEEVALYEQSLAGQIDITNAAIEDQTNLIALKLAPLQKVWVDFKLVAIGALTEILKAMVNLITNDVSAKLWSLWIGPLVGLSAALTAIKNGVSLTVTDILEIMKNAQIEMYKNIQEQRKIMLNTIDIYEQAGTDTMVGPPQLPPIPEEELRLLEKSYKDALKLKRDYEKDYAEAGRELTRDMGTTSGDVDQLLNIWNNYFDSVDQITVDGTEAFQDRTEAAMGEYGDILNEGLNKAMDIWIKYYDRLADIARKEQQDIADENVEYAQKIEDANRDAMEAEADAARKYREEELKAEREYQEKLRRLKEQYLFDLEDALRERDALQVLRLMRKYAMDKANIIRENEDDAEARKEAYQRELEDIARQRERKLQELAIEHQRRLAEIALQAERERAEAQRNRDQDLEDLKADLEQQRAERLIKYEEELQDLKDRFKDRLAEIMIGLADEEGATKEMLDKIGQLYLNMFGKDGIVDISYQNLQTMIKDAVTQAQTAFDQLQLMAEEAAKTAANLSGSVAAGTNPKSTSQIQQANLTGAGAPPYSPYAGGWKPHPGYYPGGHALGGMEYANTPTMALFGEAGPEIATFTPINRLNTNNLGLPNPYYGGGAGQSGESKMRVMIHLSPGLVGEIVDQAMGGFAQIIEER